MNINNRKRNQKGMNVLEIILAIGALLILMPFIYSMIDGQTQKVKQTLIAQKLKELEDVLINYTIVNKESFQTTSNGAKNESDLNLSNYGLTSNTDTILQKYFSLRRYYLTSEKYHNEKVEGCTAALEDACPKRLSVTAFLDINKELFMNSDDVFSYEALRKIASMAGANFAYYDGDDNNIYSISGYWRRPTSDFPNITFNADQPKIVLVIDNNVIKEYNSFLNRLDTSKNDMETYIDMNFNDVKHVKELDVDQIISKSGASYVGGASRPAGAEISKDLCKCRKWTDNSQSSICNTKEDAQGNTVSADRECITQVVYDSAASAIGNEGISLSEEALIDSIDIANEISFNGDGNGILSIRDYLLLRGELDLDKDINDGDDATSSGGYTVSLNSIQSNDQITLASNGSTINVEELVLSGSSVGSGEISDKKGIGIFERLNVSERFSANELYIANLIPNGNTPDINSTEFRANGTFTTNSLNANIIRTTSLRKYGSNQVIIGLDGILNADSIQVKGEDFNNKVNNLITSFRNTSAKTRDYICDICSKSGGRRSDIEATCPDIYPSGAGSSDSVFCGSMLAEYCGSPDTFGSVGTICSGYSFF
ncbi:MAG: hypothetical protein N4A44_01825 [Alphaproteobacteria bacterium]|jgi:hypothetical protein|nr:hypothetical protein [Alphaproteobacteria bacterium]